MREIGHPSNGLVNCAVRGSLSTVRDAYAQLRLRTGRRSAAAIVSQIELLDVMLVGISGIRAGLGLDIQRLRVAPQASDLKATLRPRSARPKNAGVAEPYPRLALWDRGSGILPACVQTGAPPQSIAAACRDQTMFPPVPMD